MAIILANGKQQYFDTNGDPLIGGLLYTWAPNTAFSTPKATYFDAAGAVPHTNPIVLDARGEATVFWTGGYDVELRTALGAVIWTVEDINIDPSAATLDTALRADLADPVTPGKGASLLGWLRNSIGAAATTIKELLGWNRLNVFEFMTTAQITSVKAYNYAVDVTAPIHAAMAAGIARNSCEIYFPPGGYFASIDFTMLAGGGGSVATEWRGIPLRLVGAGNGEPFVFNYAITRGTVIRSTGARPAIWIRQDPANPPGDSGSVDISGFRFDSDWAGYTAILESLCAQSHIHNCTFFQYNVNGSGVQVNQMSTGLFEQCHMMNSLMFTSGGGGSGIGLNIAQTVNNNGLPTILKNTCRGWQYGYSIGNGVLRTFSLAIRDSECSNTQYGVWIKPYSGSTLIDNLYCEGVSNTCVLDEGEDTTISNSRFLIGFQVGINGDFSGAGGAYGSKYVFNYIEANDSQNCNLINVTSTGAGGGPGRIVSGNRFVYSGVGAFTINGLTISGVDPRIDFSGNVFLPRGDWPGAGVKIQDLSTTSGSGGSGLYGFGTADDGTVEFPLIGRGAYGVGLSPTVLVDANVVANTLTVTKASSFVMTCVGAQTVNVITVSGGAALAGKWFCIRTTNANTTFANTANLRMAGAANYTPGAAGATIWFQYQAGVCWEQSRTAY